MTERAAEKSEMIAALIWWAAALAAALLVFFVFRMFDGTDPAAGLVFGGVAFVVVGMLMVFRGPGPKPADEGAAVAHGYGHDHGHGHGHDHAHAAAPIVEPVQEVVAEPVAAAPVTLAEPMPAAGAAVSERVRDAARAAGEAARMALGDPAPATAPEAVPAVRPAAVETPAGVADDLKRISGIGPKFEDLLHGLGIWRFQQIADWGPGEVAWIEGNLEGFRGRVTRDDWIGQAAILAAGGETEHSQRVDRGEA